MQRIKDFTGGDKSVTLPFFVIVWCGMRTITITGYKRPELFDQLLTSLIRNDLTGWKIFIQVEPTPMAEDYLQVAARVLKGGDYDIVVNPSLLGVTQNPYALMDKVFSRHNSSLNIYLEEDMVVAPDVTRLALWYAERHRSEWLCLSLLSAGCGGLGFLSYPEHADLFFPSKAFNSLGFVVRREEWEAHIRRVWTRNDPADCRLDGGIAGGWDYAVYHHLLGQENLYALQSVAARALHTGREGGVNCKPEWHDLAFDGAVLPAAKDLTYRHVALADLPPQVRRHALLWEQGHIALLALSLKERHLRSQNLSQKILATAVLLLSALLVAQTIGNIGQNNLLSWTIIVCADAGLIFGIAMWLRRRSKIRWIMGK
jgi:hypothetical protein